MITSRDNETGRRLDGGGGVWELVINYNPTWWKVEYMYLILRK